MSRQKTAKSVEEVLEWVETTPHHIAGWELKPRQRLEDAKFFYLQGDEGKLRIPLELQLQVGPFLKPGEHLDRRMYRATAVGKRKLSLWLKKNSPT